MADLKIAPVVDRRSKARFIQLPWQIYAGDPAWVPPLLWERHHHLSASNPYFNHGRWCGWIAYRKRRAVGRISAQVDELHLYHHQDTTGFFGMLEAEDDPEVFTALLETAEMWLRDQGMGSIRGPFNLSINEDCGLLVAGFEHPPRIMTGHARSYYAEQLEARGYTAARDLLAYRLNVDFKVPPVMQSVTAQTADQIRIRPLHRARLLEELELLRAIFNDAWSQNWGFIPFTEAEFRELGKALKWLVDDDLVQIAEVCGEPAAMIIALPDLNAAIHDLDGRLLPFGWLKLLWRLKMDPPERARVPLMGVRRRYQRSRLGTALVFQMIDVLRHAVARRGVQDVELSWILEENRGLHRIIEALGGSPYKRYRIYEKAL